MSNCKPVWRLLMLPWSVVKGVMSWVFFGLGLAFFLLGIAAFAICDAARKDRKWNIIDEYAERLRAEKSSQDLLRMARVNSHRHGSPSQSVHFPDE